MARSSSVQRDHERSRAAWNGHRVAQEDLGLRRLTKTHELDDPAAAVVTTGGLVLAETDETAEAGSGVVAVGGADVLSVDASGGTSARGCSFRAIQQYKSATATVPASQEGGTLHEH